MDNLHLSPEEEEEVSAIITPIIEDAQKVMAVPRRKESSSSQASTLPRRDGRARRWKCILEIYACVQ